VWVAELYRIEEVNDTIRFFRGIDEDAPDMKIRQSELDAEDDKGESRLDTLRATGFREVRQKAVKRRRVHKYLMSGAKILEDCGYIAGRCIPIIPVYGKRWVVDGVERCMGHVRLAKDAQRLKNTLLSWLAEMSMRFDIEKPILTPEQIAGHAVMWAEDNVKKFPYLLANAITDQAATPCRRTRSSTPRRRTSRPRWPRSHRSRSRPCRTSWATSRPASSCSRT
jgi:hypothetical protein